MSHGRFARWFAAILGLTALVLLFTAAVARMESSLRWTGDGEGPLELAEAERPALVLPRAEPRAQPSGNAPAFPVPVVSPTPPAAAPAAPVPAVSPTPTPELRAGAEASSGPPATSAKAAGPRHLVVELDTPVAGDDHADAEADARHDLADGRRAPAPAPAPPAPAPAEVAPPVEPAPAGSAVPPAAQTPPAPVAPSRPANPPKPAPADGSRPPTRL